MLIKNKMQIIHWKSSCIPFIIISHTRSSVQFVYSHWHEELEISRVFDGEIKFYCGGKQQTVKGKGVNLVNSEELHYAVPRFG